MEGRMKNFKVRAFITVNMAFECVTREPIEAECEEDAKNIAMSLKPTDFDAILDSSGDTTLCEVVEDCKSCSKQEDIEIRDAWEVKND
jgi:hypothetical protein